MLTCSEGAGGVHKPGAAAGAAEAAELILVHHPGGVAYGADQSTLSPQNVITTKILIITIMTEAAL